MKTKHTKGEWTITKDVYGGIYIEALNRIVVVASIVQEDYTQEDEANAKLIAAAPDLLEALLVAKDCIDMAEDWQWKMIKLAIKKATE